MDASDSGHKPMPRRKIGRPRKNEAPDVDVDWDAVDRVLVFGEKKIDPRTGAEKIEYPSLRDMARRLNLSKNRVWQYASKHQCLKRREEARACAQERFERQVIERRAQAKAVTVEDVLRLVDSYIAAFWRALLENRVRFDNIADFDRMVRLREFLLGNAKAPSANNGIIITGAVN
jgi:hypothetical protein